MTVAPCEYPQFGEQRETERSCKHPVPGPVLRVSPCIPPQHPRSSPSPSNPSGLAPGRQALTHGWGILPLVPQPGSALPLPVPTLVPRPLAPHAMFALLCTQAQTWFSHLGRVMAQNPAAPGALQSWIRLPRLPVATAEPQPGSCPGLDTIWKREPQKSPVKAVFEFLAWQQLL